MERRGMLKGIGALATAGALGGRTMAQAETKGDKNLNLAESYLTAWQKKDLRGIGEHLHPDVHFKAPMSETTGKEAFLVASERIFPILQSLTERYTIRRPSCGYLRFQLRRADWRLPHGGTDHV